MILAKQTCHNRNNIIGAISLYESSISVSHLYHPLGAAYILVGAFVWLRPECSALLSVSASLNKLQKLETSGLTIYTSGTQIRSCQTSSLYSLMASCPDSSRIEACFTLLSVLYKLCSSFLFWFLHSLDSYSVVLLLTMSAFISIQYRIISPSSLVSYASSRL